MASQIEVPNLLIKSKCKIEVLNCCVKLKFQISLSIQYSKIEVPSQLVKLVFTSKP